MASFLHRENHLSLWNDVSSTVHEGNSTLEGSSCSTLRWEIGQLKRWGSELCDRKGLTTYSDPQNKQVPMTYYHCASQWDSDNNKIFATNTEMDSLQAEEKKTRQLISCSLPKRYSGFNTSTCKDKGQDEHSNLQILPTKFLFQKKRWSHNLTIGATEEHSYQLSLSMLCKMTRNLRPPCSRTLYCYGQSFVKQYSSYTLAKRLVTIQWATKPSIWRLTLEAGVVCIKCL